MKINIVQFWQENDKCLVEFTCDVGHAVAVWIGNSLKQTSTAYIEIDVERCTKIEPLEGRPPDSLATVSKTPNGDLVGMVEELENDDPKNPILIVRLGGDLVQISIDVDDLSEINVGKFVKVSFFELKAYEVTY